MSFFQPEKYFSRITQIDVQFDLLRRGLRCVLLDIDNTIRQRDTHAVPADVVTWLAQSRAAGIRFCLLSNNWHANAYDLACELDMPIVAKACKPLPFAYLKAARKLGAKRSETVAVGDQLITDVIGAHLAGMSAYLVQPLVEADLKHTLILRNVERALLRGRVPEPAPSPAASASGVMEVHVAEANE